MHDRNPHWMWELDPAYIELDEGKLRAWLDAWALRRAPDKAQMHSDGPDALLDGWLPSEPLFGNDTRVIAFGSCFAALFVTWLADHGYNRKFPVGSDESLVRSSMEIPAAVAQHFRWAFGELDPSVALWMDRDRQHVDATEERRTVLRHTLASAEVLVIMLGGCETWFDTASGEPLWRVPPLTSDSGRYAFKVATVAESVEALETIDRLRRAHMPDLKILYMVDPQRSGVTFRGISPVVAGLTAKAIVRTAVDEFLHAHAAELNSNYFYFPAYEIVTALLHDPWFADNRHVRLDVAAWLLGVFARGYLGVDAEEAFPVSPHDELLQIVRAGEKRSSDLQQVCDERLEVIEQLAAAAEERLTLIHQLTAAADERLRLIEQLDAEVGRLRGRRARTSAGA